MSAPSGAVLQERDGPVLILTLNRPEVMNALSPAVEDELHAILRQADDDASVRAIVLTGAGRAFCAGYDMGGHSERPATTEGALHQWWKRDLGGPAKLLALMELETPVVAAVNGWCLGRGFWYALASDVTIAGESAVFAQPEVRSVSNTSFLFAMLCGWKNAHRYGLTGDHFDATEALRIGAVNEVVPDAELMATAVAFAQRVAKVPRASVRVNKAITSLGLEVLGLRSAMTLGGALSVIAHASNDAEETRHLQEALEAGDLRRFLRLRDDPFRPEPGGPRSAPAE